MGFLPKESPLILYRRRNQKMKVVQFLVNFISANKVVTDALTAGLAALVQKDAAIDLVLATQSAKDVAIESALAALSDSVAALNLAIQNVATPEAMQAMTAAIAATNAQLANVQTQNAAASVAISGLQDAQNTLASAIAASDAINATQAAEIAQIQADLQMPE